PPKQGHQYDTQFFHQSCPSQNPAQYSRAGSDCCNHRTGCCRPSPRLPSPLTRDSLGRLFFTGPLSMLRLVFITALILLPSIGSAEPTNFRAGIGAFALDIGHAPAGLPDGSQTGFSLFGEFPQSNHTASRFILYRIDGGDGVRLTGGETQLMWGMGLAQPGFRLYTGPAWHYDRMRVTRSGGHDTRTFNGWGWQIGTGWQYRAVT